MDGSYGDLRRHQQADQQAAPRGPALGAVLHRVCPQAWRRGRSGKGLWIWDCGSLDRPPGLASAWRTGYPGSTSQEHRPMRSIATRPQPAFPRRAGPLYLDSPPSSAWSLDLWSKSLAVAAAEGHGSMKMAFVPGWLHFKYTENLGAVFGTGQGLRPLFHHRLASPRSCSSPGFSRPADRQRHLSDHPGDAAWPACWATCMTASCTAHVRDMIFALPRWPQFVPVDLQRGRLAAVRRRGTDGRLQLSDLVPQDSGGCPPGDDGWQVAHDAGPRPEGNRGGPAHEIAFAPFPSGRRFA